MSSVIIFYIFLILLGFIFINKFYYESLISVTGSNDDFPFTKEMTRISDIDVITADFDNLLTNAKEFPDKDIIKTQFTKYPFYEKFPFQISNILLDYIKDRLKSNPGKTFSSDKITIVKEPYEIYYKGTELVSRNFDYYNREYILSIDIENNTHFFVRTYTFYISITNNGMSILSVSNLPVTTSASGNLQFDYDTANNNPKYMQYQ